MTTKRRRPRGGIAALPQIEKLIGGKLTLGAFMEAIRQGEELTQEAFAARLGISRSHLCDIEKGRKIVSPERAARFAHELGYAKEQFLRLALQDAVNRAGLRFSVELHAA